MLEREAAYFKAEGVDTKTKNELFGIQGLRGKALFGQIRSQIGTTGLAYAERAKIGAVLVPLSESLITNRDFQMDVGSHTNYWPYWNNYVDFLLEVLDQTPKGSDDALAIKNRVSDILRRKTVFGWNRSIDEKDFEKSLGAALIYNPKFETGPGHRLSVKSGSTAYDPKYEILTVKDSGLADV